MKRAKKSTACLPDDPVARELVRIRNLLMMDLIARGFRSEDVDLAVKMGSAEIRRALPARRIKRALKTNGTA